MREVATAAGETIFAGRARLRLLALKKKKNKKKKKKREATG